MSEAPVYSIRLIFTSKALCQEFMLRTIPEKPFDFQFDDDTSVVVTETDAAWLHKEAEQANGYRGAYKNEVLQRGVDSAMTREESLAAWDQMIRSATEAYSPG